MKRWINNLTFILMILWSIDSIRNEDGVDIHLPDLATPTFWLFLVLFITLLTFSNTNIIQAISDKVNHVLRTR